MSYFDVDWSDRFSFGDPRPTSGISRIVIHTTENPAGAPAENVANYQLTSETGSYHVLVDTSGKRLRENTDDWVTWSTGNNEGNYQGVNLSFVFYSSYTRQQWLDQERMLRAGAAVCAYWAKTHNIPVEKTDGTRRGFCGHGDLRKFGGTDHTDPGPGFPWDVFLRYVNEAMGGAPASPPAPAGPAPVTQEVRDAALNDAKLAAIEARDRARGQDAPITSLINPAVRFNPRDLQAVIDMTGWQNAVLLRAIAAKLGMNPDQIINDAVKADQEKKR